MLYNTLDTLKEQVSLDRKSLGPSKAKTEPEHRDHVLQGKWTTIVLFRIQTKPKNYTNIKPKPNQKPILKY